MITDRKRRMTGQESPPDRSLALPVPRNFLLDFVKPLRYGGRHGDSEGRIPDFPEQCSV